MHLREHIFPHFARYQILEVIGQGGMGTVYKAYQEVLKRYVALKVPHSSLLHDSVSKERFLREAEALAMLQHPHIVSIYDADMENGLPYIAMQLVEGDTLSDLIYTSLPEQEQVIDWGIQIAKALDYLHQTGVYHRDLKSSNVLISEEGKALITDFGVAHLDAGSTITQGMLGTPAYMSPEQATGRGIDARSDLYSLGIILYESLTGTVPFNNENSLALIQQIIHQKPPRINTHRADIPRWLVNIVHRCIHKKPGRRFQTGEQLAGALKNGGTASAHDGPTISLSWFYEDARAKNVSDSFKRGAREVGKQLAPLQQSTRDWLIRNRQSLQKAAQIDRNTGLLKPLRAQFDPIEFARHPFALAALVLWILLNLAIPIAFSDDSMAAEEEPLIERVEPAEKESQTQQTEPVGNESFAQQPEPEEKGSLAQQAQPIENESKNRRQFPSEIEPRERTLNPATTFPLVQQRDSSSLGLLVPQPDSTERVDSTGVSEKKSPWKPWRSNP